MSALFNFESLILSVVLLICTSAYIHAYKASWLDDRKQGFVGIFWKCARVGERLSPWISLICIFMAMRLLFFSE